MRKNILFLILLTFFSWEARGEKFTTLSGEIINTQNINSQSKAMLFFWTTWCPYCRLEIKALNNLQKELLAKDFKIFFVNLGDDKRKVKAFKDKIGISSSIILDKKGLLASKYRILGVPTYIFLREGREIGRTNYITSFLIERLYEE
ncbi:MAG TPA: TlpA family protein disulfide reductase [Candidatus Omnitrophica bacterium]|nr:MAG: hypothetical protein DRP69_04865 [Candidatus Omnitrophota bacterium]RKY44992.1 MAG: hypothetical protein DRP80_00105 [Candidatus Omnitrophota bacterium]HEC69785.1 TlpA family protein disulfide reductase [Candidatus Omnitrophota bacterium]